MKKNITTPDSIQEIPQFAITFSNTVFGIGILYFVLVVLFAVFKIFYPLDPVTIKFYYLCILFGTISASLFGFGLKLNNSLKVNLSLLIITASISVYGFETYLAFQRGIKTPLEVIKEFNEIGVEVYPNIHPGHFMKTNGLKIKNGRIYPLAGISNINSIIGVNIFETDEHGFNNSKGFYNKESVDIILSGGSFSQGFDVKPDKNICAILREMKFNAISIGMNGNGTLREYAALKEYAKPLKPNIVLISNTWGDLGDIRNASQSSILTKYLIEEKFSQNLISRQTEIDSVLKIYVSNELKKIKENEEKIYQKKFEYHWFIQILKLYNTRKTINLVPRNKFGPEPEFQDERIVFKTIISESKKMISDWGGKLYILYIPLFDYATGNDSNPRFNRDHNYHKFVLSVASEFNISVIDIFVEVFDSHPDPSSLFPYRMDGHYNADGYRLVAEAIARRLETDGFIPSNLNN